MAQRALNLLARLAVVFACVGTAAAQTRNAAPAAQPSGAETSTFDNWTYTCQMAPPPAAAQPAAPSPAQTPASQAPSPQQGATPAAAKPAPIKICWATLRVADKSGKQILLVWTLGRDAKGTPTISVTTPTSILLKDGLILALGASKRRLPYIWCDAGGCEASSPYDLAFANELSASKEATVTFTTKDGRDVAIKLSLAGTDKVVALLRARDAR